jgi:small subunit ribosomal protein S4
MEKKDKNDLKCRKCRREGAKLFLKGDKCNTGKCPLLRRNYPPGAHGPNGKNRPTGYGIQLREKQKAKRIYDLKEKQFENYVAAASKKKGNTGEFLSAILETRLDNVVYKIGLAKSRKHARQLVSHAHIIINGKRVNIPSFQVKIGQIIGLKEKDKKSEKFQPVLENLAKHQTPAWISLNVENAEGKIVAMPQGDDLKQSFDPKLIIEYYSR